MARVALPESRLRARRKKRRARLALLGAGLTAFACAVVVGLSHLPSLQIREVAVSGTKTLATSTVAQYIERQIAGHDLWVFPRRNIFLYPKRDIAAHLLVRFPELRSADVRAQNFHSIAATVVEREPKALWCPSTSSGQADCYLIDQEGIVYAPAAGGGDLVVYRGHAEGDALPRRYLDAQRFESLFTLVDALSQKLPATPVISAYVDEHGDVEAALVSGFVLKFTLSDASGDVFERFELALRSEPFAKRAIGEFAYLDLRFGDKLYYKLK